MKFLLFIIFFVPTVTTMAQKPGDKIPRFTIVLPDGSFYSTQQIKKNRPVILIYFAPDCDHCKILMKDLFKRIDEFSGTEIIMITYKPLKEVAQFIHEHNIAGYPNITVGTEIPTYFIRYYFKLTNTPFTALYNKKGALLHSYYTPTAITDLINRVKHISGTDK